MEVKKLSLNAFRGKNGLKPKQVETISEELNSYGIKLKYIDPYTHYAEVEGYDNKGKMEHTEVENIGKLLRGIREVDTLIGKVNKWRKKLDVKVYETLPLNQLTREKSSKLEGFKGYENYKKTLEKILKRDPQTNRNKIQEADYNMQKLRKVKLNAYDNADEIMNRILGDKINIQDYRKPNGQFKSKKAEREYLKIFSNIVEDEDYINSPNEFYGWLYDKYGDEYKSAYQSMSEREQSAHYGEYQMEKLEWIVGPGKGSYERDEIEMSDEEVINRMNAIRDKASGKNTVKKGRRK